MIRVTALITLSIVVLGTSNAAAGDAVRPVLNYVGEAATNPVGGFRHASSFAGQLLAGIEIDMGRAAGIQGGTLKVYLNERHGDNLQARAIGNSTSVQEVFGMQNTRLSVFAWEQRLFDDRLILEAGRLPANISFLASSLYCNFQNNSICGNPVFVAKTSNFTSWPVSSWGGHVTAKLTDTLFAHAGVYEVNPERSTQEDHGLDFGIEDATGVIVPWELGYRSTFANDAMPRGYAIGGWFDEGDYEDPLLDANGNFKPLTGLPGKVRNGRSGIYARFDQTVWRPDHASERNIAIFGVGMMGTSGRLTADSFINGGIVMTGTFPGRDRDVLGFAVSYQNFSSLALQAVQLGQDAAGGGPEIHDTEVMMELTYGAEINRNVRISPNIQYIVNPDNFALKKGPNDNDDVLVVGMKFIVDAFP